MRKFWTASAAAMAFTFMAVPAAAQAPWSASGEITDSDPGGTEPHYDDHTIRLEAGQRYRIAVDSAAFDPVARLYRAGSDQPVAENDDGEGLNSRITFTPTESGDYRLRVLSFSAEGRGAYTAGFTVLPPLPPAEAVPFRASGQIETSDPAAGSGAHYDEYVLRLEAGRRYILRVNSSAFDPMAQLFLDGNDNPLAENDDDGEGLNSRISFVPAETGNYLLRVVPLAEDGRGAYTVSAEQAPPLAAPLTRSSRTQRTVWRVYEGALANADSEGPDGARIDDYLVHFNAGQERFIALDAPDFDAVVQVIALDRRQTDETLAANDDGGNSLNSLLRFKAEAAGDYIVRVTSFGPDGRGSYTLRVSE